MDNEISRSSGNHSIKNIRRSLSEGSMSGRSSFRTAEDEEALKWAALEKLPTYDRLRKTIIQSFREHGDVTEIDVRDLGISDRRGFINRLLKVAEEDNEKLLRKFRNRIDRVGITLPTILVKFKNLVVETDCFIGDQALPTLANAAHNAVETTLTCFGIGLAQRTKFTVLKNVSGLIKPSRMTLLLGPPSSGKTTLLLALAGKLDPTLKTSGEVTYNGHSFSEFVPRKTSAYISQHDIHVGEMTVQETLEFSARCHGVGARYDLLSELTRREKAAGILPEAEVDLFMKATALQGESGFITDYALRILGLDVCRDTIIGNEMLRGVSGGQKKRVTTGEMIVGPTKTLFMDEISTGLDSSTTFQIVKCLQQVVHLTDATIFMSLLQPAPETFDLFDDIILLSEGQIVYQGPREYVVEFFESCGFKCPERKGTADFLQEVTSRKDQEQYWADRRKLYGYISVSEFAQRFKYFPVGLQLENEISDTYDKSKSHKAALVFDKYSINKRELLKANFDKEWLLIKRNFFLYVFKAVQIFMAAIITATTFLHTEMPTKNEQDGVLFIGALIFAMICNTFNGYAELSLTIMRLPVFYKHRDLLFHPPWAFTLPTFLLRIPISILETTVWMITTYYTIGFAPEPSRFFKQLLLIFLIQQMAAGIFRLIAGLCRNEIMANTGGTLALLLLFLLGGFILPRDRYPVWWRWGYMISPFSYGYNALSVNEMFAPRWMNRMAPDNKTRLGVAILNNFSIYPATRWYWIGVTALLGFTILFNILFTLALMFLNPLEKSQAVMTKDQARVMETDHQKQPNILSKKKSLNGSLSLADGSSGRTEKKHIREVYQKRGMILPFTPLTMSFDNVNYFVDMPQEVKEHGVTEDKLQLLSEVTGAFRPGILTALMGVSGAGKTTLMDVLAGRKTGGYIEGDIRISGFRKIQESFARISGYCEQTDIHSPQVTVRESLLFSSFLRLPEDVNSQQKICFVDEIIDLVELDDLKDSIVGIPEVSGLSIEQRKRLTIAVELVANPSIIFMDEPTSGLDARAAAIVMRAVRNTVDTGRTVVCTIHQPSIDIFESFDELLLLKRGGQVIYGGPLGQHSSKIIEYFETIPGVSRIKEKYNPATWMLEASSAATENCLEIDFAEYYKSTILCQKNKTLVEELSKPAPGAKDLYFATKYSQTTLGQFRCCIWKQWLTYWRSPDYNLVRYFFALTCAILVGTIFWKAGRNIDSDVHLLTIMGALYVSGLFVGINNCFTVQPVAVRERNVFYRESAAGMYSALPYAMAQVIIEVPYVLIQSTYYTLIIYSMVSLEWTVAKFFWFYFVTFCTILYFTYYGMMTVSVTPNNQVAAIVSSSFFAIWTLFCGFFIPRPRIPKWWIWYYWICPEAWTMYGLIIGQYGDVERTIKVAGSSVAPMLKTFIQEQYGYDPNFKGPVAAVLIGFALLFAFVYGFCIKTLNFQMR